MAQRARRTDMADPGSGSEPAVEPEINSFEVREGDTYYCAPTASMTWSKMTNISFDLTSLQANLPLAANQLVQMANDNGEA